MKVRVDCLSNLSALSPAHWNHLVPNSNPFLRHEFLAGLEETHCVGPRETGWTPRHLVIRPEGEPAPIAALLLYEKYDSYGEYIFDWGWARAAQAAQIPYYPKLVSAIPFTPATGPRLLIAPDAPLPADQLIGMLLDATHTLADSIGASSTHILFHPQNQAAPLTRKGFDARSSFQYHWECAPHWSAFEDYLQDMRASSRKQIRRERRLAQSHGLTLRTLRGEEFSPTHWSALWRFYRTNAYFKGAIPYLSEAFFSYLRTHLSDYVLGTFAESEQGPVAGALFFCAGDQLFGRYWGTERYMECMHFELCYYQPIEWAITHGIRRFEAGAQGDHKLKRGFLPTPCHSSHWIRDPNLARAVQDFLPEEARNIQETIRLLNAHSPFKITPETSAEEAG